MLFDMNNVFPEIFVSISSRHSARILLNTGTTTTTTTTNTTTTIFAPDLIVDVVDRTKCCEAALLRRTAG